MAHKLSLLLLWHSPSFYRLKQSLMFRSVPCMGDDTCFSLAFSVPAVLMFIAICMRKSYLKSVGH